MKNISPLFSANLTSAREVFRACGVEERDAPACGVAAAQRGAVSGVAQAEDELAQEQRVIPASRRHSRSFSNRVGDLTNRTNSPGPACTLTLPHVFEAVTPDSRIVLIG